MRREEDILGFAGRASEDLWDVATQLPPHNELGKICPETVATSSTMFTLNSSGRSTTSASTTEQLLAPHQRLSSDEMTWRQGFGVAGSSVGSGIGVDSAWLGHHRCNGLLQPSRAGWLSQVGGKARSLTAEDVLFLTVAARGDGGQRRPVIAQILKQIQTASVRESQITDEQIERLATRQIESGSDIAGAFDAMAFEGNRTRRLPWLLKGCSVPVSGAWTHQGQPLTAVDDKIITCAAWTFDRVTGGEIDEDLG